MDVSELTYLANPFCNDRQCFKERLELSEAIDLRDNFYIVNLGNGYNNIHPIDETKKWKAPERKS